VQSFSPRMPLLMATGTFGLGRRRWSCLQQCYLLHSCLVRVLLSDIYDVEHYQAFGRQFGVERLLRLSPAVGLTAPHTHRHTHVYMDHPRAVTFWTLVFQLATSLSDIENIFYHKILWFTFYVQLCIMHKIVIVHSRLVIHHFVSPSVRNIGYAPLCTLKSSCFLSTQNDDITFITEYNQNTIALLTLES